MHGSAKWILGGVGLALLCCSGCRWYPYSPYYNGYNSYGPGQYGPTYAPQPGGFVDPGGTYIPQNYGPTLNTPGSPTPLNSGTPSTSPTPNWRTPNGTGGGEAPLFNPVPNPQPDSFGPAPAAVLPRPQPLTMVSPFPQTVVANIQPTGLQTVDPFVEPATLSNDDDAQPMPVGSSPPAEPYAFDGADFKWLKGIVDFDDETKSWSIIYALVPKPTDRFGGHFVLGPSDQLQQLQRGDLVLIAGEPHPTLKDRGRPVYHVAKVTVLGRPSTTR